MPRCRKKPIEIDYWHWNGENRQDAKQFCEANNLPDWNIGTIEGATGLMIPTLEGMHIARQGDYILKGVEDEFYPCKASIFDKTYELLT